MRQLEQKFSFSAGGLAVRARRVSEQVGAVRQRNATEPLEVLKAASETAPPLAYARPPAAPVQLSALLVAVPARPVMASSRRLVGGVASVNRPPAALGRAAAVRAQPVTP